MSKITFLFLATALTLLLAAVAFSATPNVEHALVGSIEKVDKGTKTLVVKTADGTEETVKWTERTTVRGLKGAGRAADLAGREGEHVVVHYSVEGADKTARAIEHLGRATPRVAEGTIKTVGKDTREVVVKTANGTEETFRLAERAAVDSAEGVARGSKLAAREGEQVTVYYTEEAGRKIAHVIKRL